MFNYHLEDQIGKNCLTPGDGDKHQEPELEIPADVVIDEGDEWKLSSDSDIGHLEADKVNEEKYLAQLQDEIEEKERREIEKVREEDREDLENTYKRF